MLRKGVKRRDLLLIGKAMQRTGIATAATFYWARPVPIPPITLLARSLSFKHDLVDAQEMARQANSALNDLCACLLQEQQLQRSWEERLWVKHLSQISARAAARRKRRRVEPPVVPDFELARVACSGKLAVRSIPRSRDSKAITILQLPHGTPVRLTCKVCSTDSPTWFAEIHPHDDHRNLWKDFDVGFVPYDDLALVQVTHQRASEMTRK